MSGILWTGEYLSHVKGKWILLFRQASVFWVLFHIPLTSWLCYVRLWSLACSSARTTVVELARQTAMCCLFSGRPERDTFAHIPCLPGTDPHLTSRKSENRYLAEGQEEVKDMVTCWGMQPPYFHYTHFPDEVIYVWALESKFPSVS